ncbi:MAG: hypothetical protein A2V70_13380, partial [Planctomycetes bacterium RBG_13_63_9]
MACQLEPAFPGTPSPIDRVDPRVRIVAAVGFSIVVALAGQLTVLVAALAAAMLAFAFCGLPVPVVLRRLLPLNVLMLAMVLVLPLTTAGTPLVEIGSVGFSREGLLLGAKIAIKGNAIVLMLLVLLGSLEPTTLGHALSHLRVPNKLAQLLLLTVRYLDVLQHEHARLRAAMKIRGFRPRMNRHTYRTFGYLAGM